MRQPPSPPPPIPMTTVAETPSTPSVPRLSGIPGVFVKWVPSILQKGTEPPHCSTVPVLELSRPCPTAVQSMSYSCPGDPVLQLSR